MKTHNCECCGKSVEIQTITREHLMFGKPILVKNAPYFECACGYTSYLDEHIMNITIRDAFRNELTEVDFNEIQPAL